MRIEAARQAVASLPLNQRVLAELRQRARLRSTHYSTQIEGNSLTQAEVDQVIVRGKHIRQRERDEAEVKGYYVALDHAEAYAAKHTSITEAYVRKHHALVMGAGRKELAKTQHTENTAFRTEHYNRLVAHVTERLKSSQLPEEARAEILEQIEAFHDELVAHRTSHYESTVELLGTLANDADLTMEELRSSLKEHFKSIRETGKAFHEEHRARRKEFRQGIREEYGRGRGRGQGQGRNRGQGKGNGPGAGTGRGIEEAVPTSTEE